MSFHQEHEDCYVLFDGADLIIGNSRIERTWSMEGEVPVSVSLKNKESNKEWFSDPHPDGWISLGDVLASGDAVPAFAEIPSHSGERSTCYVETGVGDDFGFAAEHFLIDVVLEYDQTRVRWRHIIYPHMPVLRSCIMREREEETSCDEYDRDRVRRDNPEPVAAGPVPSGNKPDHGGYLDAFPALPLHCKWKAVRFRDATDRHNNLVATEEGLLYCRESSFLSGNLLFVKDRMSEDGFLAIKEGPTPLAYQGGVTHDFEICGNNILTSGWGCSAGEWKDAPSVTTYGSAVVLWEGSEEDALLSLQQYHRAIHRYVPRRDAFVMCNTWGDRSQSIKINEGFIRRELSLAKALGISCYQIDAGWQEGSASDPAVSQGVIEGYYRTNPDFWNVNRQGFPEGLGSIAEMAEKIKVDLGLWFSPDSVDDFCNWEKDAAVLIDLHKKYGIKAFKLDATNIRSKQGEENLFHMMRKVVGETDGKVLLNLDVTAQARSGFYGRVQYTGLFLENRYTDWHNYYPHWTLRNLWMLSKYYPAFRLQTEFLNVSRNKELYHEDPLAPSVCGIEYAFAVTMFSNPLAWMTLTGLDEEARKILGRVIPEYRNYQSGILSGTILPIGEEPSGTSWSGFQSITGEDEGFLLLLKEYNTADHHRYTLWKGKNKKLRLHHLMGQGEDRAVETDGDGRADFTLAGNFQYALYAYERKP